MAWTGRNRWFSRVAHASLFPSASGSKLFHPSHVCIPAMSAGFSVLLAVTLVCVFWACPIGAQTAGVGVGVGGGGVHTGAGVSVGTGGLIDPIARSMIMGAALGGFGGPIGMGAGALVGLIYGITQHGRLKREAEEEMNRQKEIDKSQAQEIEAIGRNRIAGQPGGGRALNLDAMGLIVLEDHLAAEKASIALLPSSSDSITGLIVVKDNLAPEPDTLGFRKVGSGVLTAKAGEFSPNADLEKEVDRLSRKAARQSQQAQGDPVMNGQMDSQLSEAEIRRQQLESEIDAELQRQKELLAKMRQTIEPGASQIAGVPAQGGGGSPVPAAPGRGGNTPPVAKTDADGFIPIFQDGRLVRKERDLKGMGRPDTIVYYDSGGQPLRREESTHFDGRIDAWTYYDHGRLVRKEADTNGDGRVDFWAFYDEQGGLARTESDTSSSGRRDLVQYYENGGVVREERFGPTGDRPRVVVVYDKGTVVRKEEDTTGSGWMDVVSQFDGRGRLIRQVRDPKGQGVPAEVRSYDPATGDLVKKEEDLHGTGKVDAISYYEGGRLVRRELYDLDDLPILRTAVLSVEDGRLR
jgi:antitoxin component YwqK of YwqJK toxin-antitoxin module